MQLPSDVAQYQDVQQLYQEVQGYQQLFVDLHRATTANSPTGEDPAALKAKLLQLDSHKQQLQDKLNKIRSKVQNVTNLPELQVSAPCNMRSADTTPSCARWQNVSTSSLHSRPVRCIGSAEAHMLSHL